MCAQYRITLVTWSAFLSHILRATISNHLSFKFALSRLWSMFSYVFTYKFWTTINYKLSLILFKPLIISCFKMCYWYTLTYQITKYFRWYHYDSAYVVKKLICWHVLIFSLKISTLYLFLYFILLYLYYFKYSKTFLISSQAAAVMVSLETIVLFPFDLSLHTLRTHCCLLLSTNYC